MKKTLSIFAFTFLIILTVAAQETRLIANNSNNEKKEVLLREMELPEFIGGQEAMATFIQQQIIYPDLAFRQGVEGVVLVNFRISEKGEILKPYIAQSVHPDLDNEALRLIKEMPKWSPALQNGVPKEVAYQLPIRFELNN
ncbi:TonB family protein [Belliella baltica DSM 15883]|uniref:TonB family protein n=1 Tax=Belliella baltica (strain DSM 15883 / CIP 108006 / LMG 21964 / BA134) TaxID=866536 RepID=I3Z1M5_BELBD|nr:energy transducer TonB [Belliella baltica]AFL83143.1 TonB family protein [Belliella baltica DSM 15883]